MVEVANAYETVLLQRKVLDVARLARELSEEQVSGETARFDAGFTTHFEVCATSAIWARPGCASCAP